MADDERDRQRIKTPPAGVQAQIAPSSVPSSVPETWEDGRTGVTPVRTPTASEEESPVATIVRRSGETKNMVIDVHTDVGTLHGRVETLEKKVDKIGKAVEDQGKQNKEIIGMTSDVISILKNQQTVTTTVAIAETEVKKTRAMTDLELEKSEKLADLEDRKASRGLARERRMKLFERVALPVLIAAATLIVAYLTKCGA